MREMRDPPAMASVSPVPAFEEGGLYFCASTGLLFVFFNVKSNGYVSAIVVNEGRGQWAGAVVDFMPGRKLWKKL